MMMQLPLALSRRSSFSGLPGTVFAMIGLNQHERGPSTPEEENNKEEWQPHYVWMMQRLGDRGFVEVCGTCLYRRGAGLASDDLTYYAVSDYPSVHVCT